MAFQGAGDMREDLRLTAAVSDSQTGETGWTIEDAWRIKGEIYFLRIDPPDRHPRRSATAPAGGGGS